MARITNLVQNGRAKYTSGTVEVRRNLANRPASTRTDLDPGDLGFKPRWAGTGGEQEISLLTGIQGPAGTGITTAIRKTWTVVGTNLFDIAFSNAGGSVNGYPITPGDVYTISSYWRLSRSQNSVLNNQMIVTFYDSSGANLGDVFGSDYNGPIIAGEWKRVSITVTVPENASFMTPYVRVLLKDNASLQVGDTLDATGLLVEKSSVLGDYFDGSYSPDPDLTPSWTGTANASASVLLGDSPPGWRPDSTYTSNHSSVCCFSANTDANTFATVRTNGAKWFAASFDFKGDSGITIWGNIRLEQQGPPYTGNQLMPPEDVVLDGQWHHYVVSCLVPVSEEWALLIFFNNNAKYFLTNVISSTAETEAEALAAVQTYFDGDTPPFRYGPIAQIVTPKWSGTAGQSSSYFDYEEPWELGTQWDGAAARAFELGVDRGMFYPSTGAGVAWNGLINVSEKPSNLTITPYYQDGAKYYNDASTPEFSASVEAYTYPDILQEYTGMLKVYNGLYSDEQPLRPFGLSYRTKIGDGVYGPDIFYKIHLVYNALAIPSTRSYGTVNENPEAASFSWELQTLPAAFANYGPTSHLMIDSRKFAAGKLKNLETILYGTSTTSARLPLPAEVQTILA